MVLLLILLIPMDLPILLPGNIIDRSNPDMAQYLTPDVLLDSNKLYVGFIAGMPGIRKMVMAIIILLREARMVILKCRNFPSCSGKIVTLY